MHRFAVAAMLLGTLVGAQVKADVISSLFSTGFNAGGTLATEGSVDAHWTIVSNAGGTGSTAYITTTDGFPIGAWIPNQPNGQWIQPTSGSTDTHVPGVYTFQTQFSLAGFEANTASIQFTAAADNRITDVLINGFSTGFTWTGASGSGDAYASFSPQFTISNPAFFQNGINTLQFVVENDGPPNDPTNPTGLLVVLSGTANPVPEPSTMILVGLMGAGAFAVRRIRRGKNAA